MSISAPNRFPNLQGIMDLFRSLINDDGSGADGPTGGIIATNTAPFSLVFLNAAIRDLYRDLRNVGDPELIVDNYLVLGLPALTRANPALQVSLGFLGFFDGLTMRPQWTLPAGATSVQRVWERVSLTGAGQGEFRTMHQVAGGLEPRYQSALNRHWEWRGNAVWMPGSVSSVDLRLRCQIALPDFQGSNLDFTTTYVPVLNCTNAVVDKMLVNYARRFAPDQLAGAQASAAGSMFGLQLEIVREQQGAVCHRPDFGEEAVGGFA